MLRFQKSPWQAENGLVEQRRQQGDLSEAVADIHMTDEAALEESGSSERKRSGCLLERQNQQDWAMRYSWG